MKASLRIIAIGVWLCASVASANDSMVGGLDAEIAALLDDLDSDQFAERALAARRLGELAERDDARQPLADAVEQAWVDPETSFEVRKQLERIRRKLPPARLRPMAETDSGEIARLVAQMADESYARRVGAESRLRWLLGNPKAVASIYRQLKRTAADGSAGDEQTRSLTLIFEEARAAWIESAEDETVATEPSSRRLEHWVSELATLTGGEIFRLTGRPLAELELRDLLAESGNVDPIRSALEARLAEGDLSPESKERLDDLIELTRPAMVAEYWQGGRHLNIQRLLVDVPSVSEGGTSHFDHVDDDRAHCVTGVNLTEGDYPVGAAIPHPTHRTAFFHLINLPTPRRRMAYEYWARQGEAKRYAAIAERTLARLLVLGRPISEAELTMIIQFDPATVSRFAGRYLAAADDAPVDARLQSGPNPTSRQRPSVHGLLCAWLATKGTNAAVPGLLAAIDADRMLPPSQTMPYRFDRLAALALARRDPWPEVDDWLARMVPQTETLIQDRKQAPRLGATAASILLKRHNRRPEEFGLAVSPDAFARQYGVVLYRYASPEAHEQVAAWWREQQGVNKPNRSAKGPGKESDE